MKKITFLVLVMFAFMWQSNAQYCVDGPTDTADSNVQQVDITGDATSAISFTGCPGVLGVQDLTAEFVDVTAGGTYTISVTFGTCGLPYAGNGAAWIDFNRDFDFDITTEVIGTSSGTPGTAPWDAPVDFTFTVPVDATNGATRMRISHLESDFSTVQPCNFSVAYGSVMDFTINISGGIDPPACSDPIGPTASNITFESADLSWTEAGTSTSWNIELVDLTAGETATGTATFTAGTNPITVTGLASSNDYEYYVQADCGGSVTAWVGPYAFTTSITPPTNNECSVATTLTAGAVYGDNPIDGTLIGATDSGFTNSCGGAATNDVWYTIVVPASGDITIETAADIATGTPGNDTVIEGYTSDSDCSGTLTSVGCDDDGSAGSYSKLELTGLTAGATLYVRVWGVGDDEFEPFSISAYSASLSLDAPENIAAFTSYPNPVKNTLTLNAQNTIENVTVYNMLGQVVLKATPNAISSDLNTSSLQTGTYFVQVTIANVTKTVRVIKQ